MKRNSLLSISSESRDGDFSSLSMESIAPQYNDKAIAEFNAVIGKMRADYHETGLKNLLDYLKTLSKIFTDRFGIPTEFIVGPALVGPCTATYSILDKSTGFDHTSDFLKDWVFLMLNKKDAENLKKQTELFSKYVLEHDIKIDLKNAYVTGLPKDYDCFIACNWVNMFHKGDMWYIEKDEAITALCLHEMGHVFSRLQYAARTRRAFVMLEASLQDVIKNKSDAGYQFVLSYRKNVNPDFDSDQFKGHNLKTIAFGILKDIKERYSYDLSLNRPETNMEIVADVFAARFGYGSYLSECLEGFLNNPYSLHQVTRTHILMFKLVPLGFAIALCLLPAISGGLALIPGLIAGALSALIPLFTIKTANEDHMDMIYEIPYLRLEKVFQDSIRQLRTYSNKLSNSDKKKLLKGIDDIKACMEKIKQAGGKTEAIPVQRFFEFLNNNLKTAREISQFTENIERLMENPLHADQYRFKG